MINIGIEVLSVENWWKDEDDFPFFVKNNIKQRIMADVNSVRNNYLCMLVGIGDQIDDNIKRTS